MIKNGLLRPEDFKYAALSYCWGPKKDAVTQTKTERDSFIARLQEIPRHEMSLVMRDAVKVCEALGLRFLWIDSLCIVQNDVKDWERESEQMGSIYLHSFISICVPASSSCHQVFLDRQNRKVNVKFQPSINSAIKGAYTIEEAGLASQLGGYYPGQCISYNIDVNVSSWASRGWVYQERALSRRKLVFGRSMFHYSCAIQTVSENGYVQLFSPLELVTAPLIPTLQAIKDRLLRDEDIHMAWAEICCEYASLQLTQQLDAWQVLEGTNQFGRISEGVVSMTGRLASFPTLSVSGKYPSTFARRLREAGKYIADCVLDWVTSDNGEEQRSLLLMPLLSTCAGTTPNSVIFSEVVDIDAVSAERYDEPYKPPSDSMGFTQILFGKISKGSNSEQAGEGTFGIPNIHLPGDFMSFEQSCCIREMDNRDTFGLILHPAEVTRQILESGRFLFSSTSRRRYGLIP